MPRYRSYAKINLYLDITGVRGALHSLDMIMQSVSLYDELTFEPILDNKVEIICTQPGLCRNNIIESAFLKTQQAFPQIRHGFRVILNKKIPMGAGLAGGSGNAAATVHYLLNYHRIKISPPNLRALLLSIGSDVVFCYRGGTRRVRGVGDELHSIKTPHRHVLVVNPRIAVNTAEAYRLWDAFSIGGTRVDSPPRDLSLPFNAFESVIFPLYPEIASLKSKLIEIGATVALMSGSGSTVFGVFDTKALCDQAANRLDRKLYDVWVTRTISTGISCLERQ